MLESMASTKELLTGATGPQGNADPILALVNNVGSIDLSAMFFDDVEVSSPCLLSKSFLGVNLSKSTLIMRTTSVLMYFEGLSAAKLPPSSRTWNRGLALVRRWSGKT